MTTVTSQRRSTSYCSGMPFAVFSRASTRGNGLTMLGVKTVSSSLLAVSLTLLLLSVSAQGQENLHAPCMGCRLFNLEHRLHPEPNKTDTVFCHYPCQCPYEELTCHVGVNVIKDGCGCCYMCARQPGDVCSVRDLCDHKKGLYCDRKDDQSVGNCRVRESRRSCNVGGVTYKDGEKFQPECSKLCTCQNGFYGCVSICPQEQHKPSELTCHEPKLIKVKNKCCREWQCQKMEADGNSRAELQGLKSQNRVANNPIWSDQSTTSPAPLPTTPAVPETCHAKSTDWSPCSATCDVGVVVRIVVDSITCMHVQERKLCYLRPCSLNVTTTLGRNKCTPTTRSESRVRITHQDCLSVREYKLKFCTNCRQGACCYPKKTRTSTMEFQCSGGLRKTFNYMWIKKCRCDKVCYQKDSKRKRRMRRRRLRNREKGRGRRRNRDRKSRRNRFNKWLASRRKARKRQQKMD